MSIRTMLSLATLAHLDRAQELRDAALDTLARLEVTRAIHLCTASSARGAR